MNALATISEGIGYGPLSSISQGFLTLIPTRFEPDFEQFFQVNVQEPSAQVSVRHPLFKMAIRRPAIAVWVPVDAP